MLDVKTPGHVLAGATSLSPLLTPPEVSTAESLGRLRMASRRPVRSAREGQTPSSSNKHLLYCHTLAF